MGIITIDMPATTPLAKENARNYQKDYWKANSERRLAIQKRYREKHKQTLLEKEAARRQANPDYDRVKGKRWRIRNRAKQLWQYANREAAVKDIPFDLTVEWIQKRLDAGLCEVTQLPFDESSTTKFNPYKPSLDKKNPAGGYTQDNVQMVVWVYNLAKGTWSHDVVMTLAKALCQHDNAK